MKSKRGFTLVEAVIVAVVIVLLLAVLIPYVRERERQRLQAVADTEPCTIGFLGFGGATIWSPIWMVSSWKVCGKELIDSLVYGLAMGAVFMALWPSGA